MEDVRAMLGAYRDLIPVGSGPDFQLVETARGDDQAVLCLLPGSAELARREVAHSRRVGAPGIADPRPGKGRDAMALVELPGWERSRQLTTAPTVSPGTLRQGLVVLLSTLSQAHARGLVHGRIGPEYVLLDDAGRFALFGWAGARDLDREEEDGPDAPTVTGDLEALGRTFHPLLRDACREVHAGTESPAGGVVSDVLLVPDQGITRDFTRVLARLLSQDPREVYGGAHEVLFELGEADRSLGEPKERLPWEDARREVEVVRHVAREAVRDADHTDYVAVVELVAPAGTGKSAVLDDIASAVRRDGGLVFRAGGSETGAWGPFTSLTKQLLGLVEPDTPVLTELDVELRALLGERGQVGAASGVVGGVAAAVGDLLEAVFREDHGVVLLDDADHLNAATRAVWQSIIRWRHRRHLAGDGVPLAFVATSTSAAPEEPGLPTRVIELERVPVERLAEGLECVLWEPELARDLAQRLHDAGDGWPRSIRGCWTDLIERGVLVKDGRRLHVRQSLDSARVWTDATTRNLERAYANHGRHVRRLLEVLAVAGRLPVDRRACVKLSELSGPSLWRAAEAIERTGLVKRIGSGWHIESPGVRAKVYSALGEERRHGLHRELLAHFQRSESTNLDAQALHARRSDHPAAAELTEQAIRACRTRGDLREAVEHIRDLEHHPAQASESPELWLLAAETLGQSGDVAEALELTERALNSGRLTLRGQIQARVLCARLELSFDRPTRVMRLDVPYCAGAEDELTSLRWYRAAAFAMLGREDRALREQRLAEAERAGQEESLTQRYSRIRFRAELLFLRRDYLGAHSCQLEAVRVARRIDPNYLFVENAVKLTQTARLSGNSLAPRLFQRAEELIWDRRLQFSYVRVRQLCESTRLPSYRTARFAPRRDPVEALAVSRSAAARVGASHIEMILRFKHIRRCAMTAGPPPRDLVRVVRSAPPPPQWGDQTARMASFDAVGFALYYGDESYIEQLKTRASAGPRVPFTRRVMDMCDAYMLYLQAERAADACIQLLRDTHEDYEAGVIKIQDRAPIPWMLAALIRTKSTPAEWDWEALMRWARLPQDCWGECALRCALLIWRQEDFDCESWLRLADSLQDLAAPFPAALEWQRLIVSAHAAMLRGDPGSAIELEGRARRELVHLSRVSDRTSAAYYRTCLARARAGISLSRDGREVVRGEDRERTARRLWVRMACDVVCDPSTVVWLCVRDLNLAEEIERGLEERGVLVARGPGEAATSGGSVALFPEDTDWSDDVGSPLSVVSRLPWVYARTALTRGPWFGRQGSATIDGFDVVGSYVHHVIQKAEDPRLAELLGERDFARWCELYGWPGGARELGAVVAAAHGAREAAIDVARRVVYRVGLDSIDRLTGTLIQAAYDHRRGRQMAELVYLTGLPRRTVQRVARRLVEGGVLTRSGRGSGVHYSLSSSTARVRQLLTERLW